MAISSQIRVSVNLSNGVIPVLPSSRGRQSHAAPSIAPVNVTARLEFSAGMQLNKWFSQF